MVNDSTQMTETDVYPSRKLLIIFQTAKLLRSHKAPTSVKVKQPAQRLLLFPDQTDSLIFTLFDNVFFGTSDNNNPPEKALLCSFCCTLMKSIQFCSIKLELRCSLLFRVTFFFSFLGQPSHILSYLELIRLLYDDLQLLVFAQTGTAHLGHLLLFCSDQRLVLVGVT